MIHEKTQHPLWKLILPLLLLSNAAHLTDSILSWTIILSFFLFVPGYLLLMRLNKIESFDWGTLSLSVGLSLFIITTTGLSLNSLSFFGLSRPLQATNIYLALDIVVLLLISLNYRVQFAFPKIKLKFSVEEAVYISIFTLLPFLAVGGAFRLNNGASNVLTMVMMGSIGAIYVILMLRNNVEKIYPYAVFTTSLALLLCISMRGWSITGHDIHHEFSVFNSVLVNEFWQYRTVHGDPYNACLSITILPTILTKLTGIDPIYIYKLVFQIIFSSIIPALYIFARRFASPNKALLGIFAFMTFPTFTNDLPFLNRQEIAFIYFVLLLYVNFSVMKYRVKTALTGILLLSIIFSHYSTSYATVSLLFLGLIIYKVLAKAFSQVDNYKIPLLRTPIIIMAFLATFAWNAQITNSSSNLSNTLGKTISGIFSQNADSSNFSHYNLLSPSTARSPAQQFANYANQRNSSAQYLPPQLLPVTALGREISKLIDVRRLNSTIHTIIAKILQLLVLIGLTIMAISYLKNRKNIEGQNLYHISLSISCLIALVIFTLFPQLSIGYDVTRLFQQSMMILWLPVIVAMGVLFSWLGRFRLAASAALLVFLYFNLAGFAPQLTGGFLPQLSLNNSGLYYDYFYTRKSDIVASDWLSNNRISYLNVFMDTNSAAPPLRYPVSVGLISGYPLGYYYRDYTNNSRNIYRTFFSSGFVEYTNPAITANKSLVYSNGEATINFGGTPIY